MGNSLEEEEVTLDSSMAGPSGASSRIGCSSGNLDMYDWKEISDSKQGGTTACNTCFTVTFYAKKCGCFNAKMKCMHVSLCSINGRAVYRIFAKGGRTWSMSKRGGQGCS